MTLTPVQFSTRAQKAGLLLPKVGLSPVAALAKLCEAPAAAKKNHDYGNKSPSPIPGIGSLITHGLAALDRGSGAYVPTDKGREYLEKLRAANLA